MWLTGRAPNRAEQTGAPDVRLHAPPAAFRYSRIADHQLRDLLAADAGAERSARRLAAHHPARSAGADARGARARPAVFRPFSALAQAILRQRAAESATGLDGPRHRRRASRARAVLADAQPCRRSDRAATATNFVGGWARLSVRRCARHSHRRALRLSAAFVVRPDRRLRLDGRDILRQPSSQASC